MPTDDLITCKLCGGKGTWIETEKVKRLDGTNRYIAVVSCANPRCHQSGMGQHKNEAEVIQLAKQNWTDRNEVIL